MPNRIDVNWKRTNQARLAAMIDVNQVRIKVQVGVSAHLNGSISRIQCSCTRGKRHLGEQAKRCHGDFGDGFRSEALFTNDDFLDFSMGRLLPMRGERCHNFKYSIDGWTLAAYA